MRQQRDFAEVTLTDEAERWIEENCAVAGAFPCAPILMFDVCYWDKAAEVAAAYRVAHGEAVRALGRTRVWVHMYLVKID